MDTNLAVIGDTIFRRRGCSPSKKSKRSVEVENYGIVWWADFCVGYSLPMLCLYAFRGIPFGTLNAGDVSISILPSQENVYVFNVAELISNVSTTTGDVVAGLIATKPQHGNRAVSD